MEILFRKPCITTFEWLLLTELCTCIWIGPSSFGNIYSFGLWRLDLPLYFCSVLVIACVLIYDNVLI